jgi:hypothetical protein
MTYWPPPSGPEIQSPGLRGHFYLAGRRKTGSLRRDSPPRIAILASVGQSFMVEALRTG